jgi:hypothetical protein
MHVQVTLYEHVRKCNKQKPGKMSQTTILKTGVCKPMTFLNVEDFNTKLKKIISAAETSTRRNLFDSHQTTSDLPRTCLA